MRWFTNKWFIHYYAPDNGAGAGSGAGAADDENAGAETDSDDDESGSDEKDKSKDKGGKDKGKDEKKVPLSDLVKTRDRARKAEAENAKLKERIEKLERANMSDEDKAKAAKADDDNKVRNLELKLAKRDALADALSDLADDMEVPKDRMAKLRDRVEKLNVDPADVADEVRELVELLAVPKSDADNDADPKKKTSTTPSKKQGGGKQRDPKSYTGNELSELQRDDPDEYKRVMKARKSSGPRWGGKKPDQK